jgi:DNA-binding CsgD family transcriptional regulator
VPRVDKIAAMKPVSPVSRNGGGAPLVGRDEAFGQLLDVLAEVRKGHIGFVVLTGAQGMGKSALLGSFLHHCRSSSRSVRVLSAAGDRWEKQFPLAGYTQIMKEPLLRHSSGIGKNGLYDAGVGDREAITPDQALNLASTVLAQLDELQRHSTVVVAVDDVHHLDEASLRILMYVMRRVSGQRIMFVLTSDTSLAKDVPASALDFLTGDQVTRVPLAPLTPEHVQQLAGQSFGIELTAAAANGLAAHAKGSPQMATELLNELPAETWHAWFSSLPPSLRMQAKVLSTIDRSSPELVAVAEALAVLGDRAATSDVTSVSGVQKFIEVLDEAHAVGLLKVSVGRSQSVVEFDDIGAAEVIYDHIVPSRRMDLHCRAAAVVQDEGDRLGHRVSATPGPDEELATELESYAARQSVAGAWHDAATALFSASRLALSRRSRDERLLRAVDALVGSGNMAQVETWLAAVDGMPASALRSSVLGYVNTASGQDLSAQTQLEAAWRTSNATRDPSGAARVAQRFTLHGLASWEGPLITGWAEKAMTLTQPGTPAHIESEAIYGLGLFAQGRMGEAEASYTRAFEHAAENAQKQRAQMGAGWLALRTDDVEKALVNLEAAAPTGFSGGSLRISLWAEAWLARAQLVLGDWDSAASTIDRASVRLESARMPLIRPLLYWTAAELWSMRGDWDRAGHYVSQAAVQAGGYRAMQVPASLARARFHEARADYDGVLAAVQPLVEIDPWTDDRVSFWPWQDTYVNALVMTDKLDDAETFLTDFEQIRRERNIPSDMARMAWARGRLLAAQGDPDTAREYFESALGHLRGLRRPYLHARISFAFGQSMRRAGKRRLATTVLKAARDLYDSLGAATYVERCNRELKAAGADANPQPDPADPILAALDRTHVTLTAQEQAVARLVAFGATNKETARSLFVAEKTVQYHLTRIYAKLGIRSRSELAARYQSAD